MRNEIEHYGEGLFACVMDSYDYDNALDNVLPKSAPAPHIERERARRTPQLQVNPN